MAVYKKLGCSTIRRKPKAEKEVKTAGLDVAEETNDIVKELQREVQEMKSFLEPRKERGRTIGSQFPGTDSRSQSRESLLKP